MRKPAITPSAVLAAILEETRGSRRGVKLDMVPVLMNAAGTAARDKVDGVLITLRARKLIRGDAQGRLWVTEAGEAELKDTPPALPSTRDERGRESKQMPPPERPKSLDTLRPRQAIAPKPVTRPAAPAREPSPAAKTCQAAGCNRPAIAEPNASLCKGCRDHMTWPPKQSPAGQSPRAGHSRPIPSDLIRRCAAMQLALMDDARRRHAAGEPGALEELVWLRETGRQLLVVGGEA